MTSRIGCRDLRVVARGRELLHVDRLDVAAGAVLAVLGPNGAGKSTLLRALARLGRHHVTGEVLLDGSPAGPREMRGAVAAVLQRPILLDRLLSHLKMACSRACEAGEGLLATHHTPRHKA